MDELWTIERTAEFFSVTVATVRRWIKHSQLTGIRIGGKNWRIPRKAVESMLKAGAVTAPASKKPPAAAVSKPGRRVKAGD